MNYKEVKAINNSILKYLNPEQGGSPSKFYKEFNNPTEREEKDYEKFGSALHCYILEPKKFEEEYLIERFERDSNYKLIEESLKYQPDCSFIELIDLLANDYMEKKAAKKEETRTRHYKERLVELEKYEAKFDFLKACEGRKVLSQDEYTKIIQIDLNIKQHPVASKLIEEATDFEYEGYGELFGLPTKYKIDIKGKGYKAEIKTTSKSVYSFEESFENYFYGSQCAFYNLNENSNDDFYFIVVNSIDCSVAVYKVSEHNFKLYNHIIEGLFTEIKWQQEHPENNWKYFSWEVENNYVINL